MCLAGHDDGRHFEISWEKCRRILAGLKGLTGPILEHRAFLIAIFLALFVVGGTAVSSKIKHSIIRAIECVGRSAELQGRIFVDTNKRSSDWIGKIACVE
jgi:hypothetical protein